MNPANALPFPFWTMLLCLFQAASAPPVTGPQTVAEQSAYQATSRYQDVVDFCNQLTEKSKVVRQAVLGTSAEGRKIPLLILADPPISTPEEAAKSGKLVVYLQGNIHAGEIDAKEALLMLARDIALAPKHPLLKDLIVVIAPIFNPDGNERLSRTHRPGQAGPELTGTRTNAQGLDLNRDFVKLESPEVRALVRFLNQWDPAVIVDGHTTNGSRHRFLVTFEGPRSLAGDQAVANFVRDDMLPAVSKDLKKSGDIDSFFYGTFTSGRDGWQTVPGTPRYGIHYAGLRNRIGILSESYAYASFKDRVRGSREFMRGLLVYCAANKEKIQKLLKTARESVTAAAKDPKSAGVVTLRQREVSLKQKVAIKGFEEEIKDGRKVATDRPKDYTVDYLGAAESVQTVPRTGIYLIPAAFEKAIENLQRHGITVEQLREDIDLPLEVYKIDKIDRAASAFQNHQTIRLEATSRELTRRVPAGIRVVRMSQPLGSLAAYLLEPQSQDGLATWNFFDQGLQVGSEYPVVRVGEQAPLLTGPIRPLAEDRVMNKPITYDLVYGNRPPNFNGQPTVISRWLDDGEHFIQQIGGRSYKVRALTGEAVPVDVAAASSSPGRGRGRPQPRSAAPGEPTVLEKEGDLYLDKHDGSDPVRLTKSAGKKKELYSLSPDHKTVAFVQGNNLLVVDVATQTERSLTTDGTSLISNGKADWVYFEEIFNRRWRCYWWSPDSQSLVFLRLDDAPVKAFTVIDEIPTPPLIESTPYPLAGAPNPLVKICVASIATGKTRVVETPAYAEKTTLFPRAGFLPDSKSVYFYAQDRAQTWLDFCVAPVEGGPARKLFRNTTKAYVEDPGEPKFLKDGSFLLTSERTGFRHFYLHGKDGNLIRQVTSGDWEVRSLALVDEERGLLYFTGMCDNPIGANLYRIKLDGSGLERLTTAPGDHQVSMSPKGNLFVDAFSNTSTPTQTHLCRADGTLARILDTNPVFNYEEFRLGTFESVQIRTPDGFVLEGSVLLPPGFDPRKKYPVWFMTYGGPHTPTIRDSWSVGRLLDQLLANMGIIVFRCDPRSASGRGAVYVFTAYKQLGVQELADVRTAIEWLCQRPYIDRTRIGMMGTSYGGFLTAYAMTHSKLFRSGIAGAPVTDWHDYDSIYTERYMNLPDLNKAGYSKTSVVKAAKDLSGKLLIIHGVMDDNVHIQNTLQLMQELQRYDKDFEVMFYARARHGNFGKHYNRFTIDFIRRSLGVAEP